MVASADVDVAVSDAEMVCVGLVEIVAHCERLHDERPPEAGRDVHDGVLRQQLHSDQYDYHPPNTHSHHSRSYINQHSPNIQIYKPPPYILSPIPSKYKLYS